MKLKPTFTSVKHPPPHSPPPEGCPKGGVVDSPKTSMPPPPNPILCSINNIPIKRNFIENRPYNTTLIQRAKEKRKAGILSEVLFWQQVHKRAFHNTDFDRQRIIGIYIVDFYIKALGLVIEIDGSSHDTKVDYDRMRQLYLEGLGLRVYRLKDGDVKINLAVVMEELERYIVEEYGD